VRAAALLVAGDAAFALRSYKPALVRYSEFLSLQSSGPDAAHGVLQLGWTGLRDGQRDAARQSWIEVADRFPDDPRAPLALLLAAELASQAGDTTTATALLDRVITDFPSSAQAGPARLSRSILALRANREDAAVRDLDEVLRSSGTSAIVARRWVRDSLAVPGNEAALEASAATPRGNAAVATGESLERFATAFVQAGDRDSNVYVLHGLSLVGAADRGWSDAEVATLVERLVNGWPSYPPAPTLLARVAGAAAAAGQWPIARRAYETLIARYPGSATAAAARVDLAEALFRTGAKAEARGHLKDAIAAGGDSAPRALVLLAEVEESLGNRRDSQAAYDKALRAQPRANGSVSSVLSHARQLEAAGQTDDARSLLQRIVAVSDGEVAAEASYRIARILSAQGQHAAAIEWFITAAYVAPSPWQRPSLLGAVRCFTALDRPQEALIAYRKLMATPAGTQIGPAVSASPALLDQKDERDGIGDATLQLAQALQRAGNNDAAVEMYLSAARLTNGGPATSRALIGAMQSFVAAGDRASAEAVYRRLLESGEADPALLSEARTTILSR